MKPTKPNNATTIKDQLHRPLRDLRISVTDRCQFRCQYCLPADQVDVMRQQSQPGKHLSYDQIHQVVAASAQLGVEKIRLTGGEPLLRKNIHHLIRDIKQLDHIREVALTTNAALLDPVLDDLLEAGLDRITISMDALDQELFNQITGTQYPVERLLQTIARCAAAPLQQVKINCVVQDNVNVNQVIPMLAHFRGSGVVVRFIEFMDVGTLNGWQAHQVVNSDQLLQQINARWPIKPLQPLQIGEVASRYAFEDGLGEFGMISSISQPFCHDCNRARLSTDGRIYTCLFAESGHDIKPWLDQPDLLQAAISDIWSQRSDQYSALRYRAAQSGIKAKKIEMFQIGG